MPAGSGAQNGGGALGVNLSSGSRVSGVSSRRRRARRGPGGCRRTAAAPGPAPHDRAEASGSRAQLMPCRGQPASGRARGSSRGQGVLSSDARENRVQCRAQIDLSAPELPASTACRCSEAKRSQDALVFSPPLSHVRGTQLAPLTVFRLLLCRLTFPDSLPVR